MTTTGSTPAPSALDGSALCFECGLCCDGTLFPSLVVHIPERDFAVSLGLPVREDPDGGFVAPLPCSAFVDGCCSLYEVGRPMTCASYECGVLTEYTAGHVGRAASRAVIGLMRSVAHDLEVEMGLAPGTYTMEAMARFLTEHQPWGAPERYRRFLIAFHQFDTVGLEHFGRTARPDEVRASAAGARLAAVAGP